MKRFKKQVLKLTMHILGRDRLADEDWGKANLSWHVEDIASEGERVSHLYPNDCYYAHLSIYRFAQAFCRNGLVLDAGSGAGYGAAYLADHGARFCEAVDVSEKAVAFSRSHFPRRNLRFHVMDLQRISGFPSGFFDLVFSSNTLEHVVDVPAFLRAAWQVIKPQGVLLVAVPPIANEESWAASLVNLYHLNIWSPAQWYYVLSLYFAEVQPYRHRFQKPGVTLDFQNTPAQTTINEEDFVFEPVALEQLLRLPTLTAIFVVRTPRASKDLPLSDDRLTFVDKSFTRKPPRRVVQRVVVKLQHILQSS